MENSLIEIAPRAAAAPTSPSVGIFWKVGETLLVDRSSLESAEIYGDCRTHSAGHYERWEEWRGWGSRRLVTLGYPLAILSTEYEEWPRGRVTYEISQRRFVIYADRRLQTPLVSEKIKNVFGLSQCDVSLRSDSHYR